MGSGPAEVVAAAEAAVEQLAGAFATSAVSGSVEQWAGAVGALQRVVDVAVAAQDAAIVRLAAIECELAEDGTVLATHRALGHVALDAPAVLSGVLGVSASFAESRVRAAVRLAADGPPGTDTESGLGGLHAAMAAGRLDAYRAGVVAQELEFVPAAVAATVVAALEAYLGVEDGAHLRRRCRRVLAAVSPDLLVQRARRARAECGLRRWVSEPGVDRWEGTFPSEDAAQAWAAIDALARRYVADGVCAGIEQARAKALTDLVAGNATVATVLTVTVPATALDTDTDTDTEPATGVTSGATAAHGVQPDGADGSDGEPAGQAAGSRSVSGSGSGGGSGSGAGSGSGGGSGEGCGSGGGRSGDDLVEVTGPNGNQPVFVPRHWLSTTLAAGASGPGLEVAPCHPVTGALLDPDTLRTTAKPVPGDHSEHDTDTDDEPTASGPAGVGDRPAGPALSSDPLSSDAEPSAVAERDQPAEATRMDDRLGGRALSSDPECSDTEPSGSAERDQAAETLYGEASPGGDEPSSVAQPSGPGEGDQETKETKETKETTRDPVAVLEGAATAFGADAYRPSTRMAKRVRARDRRCRFPGCTIAAVFCDLDHVRPWPRGRTHDTNLICLCRRHHRIKQRQGWRVHLAPDGTATWTDPTGRTRTTHPADALHATVLPGAAATATPATGAGTTSRARTWPPDGPHSELEFRLEHHGAASPTTTATTTWYDDHGHRHRHRTELQPPTATIVLDRDHWPHPRPRTRSRSRPDDNDPPPF